MKKFSKKFSLAVLFLVMLINVATRYKSKKVIFFGDSITQAGVQGNGYINMLKTSLDANQFELIGAGVGGNKVYDL